jgi:hypothetical protein
LDGANQEAIAAWMFQSMENGRANAFRIVMAVSDIPIVGRASLSYAIKLVIEKAKTMQYYGLYKITTKEGLNITEFTKSQRKKVVMQHVKLLETSFVR